MFLCTPNQSAMAAWVATPCTYKWPINEHQVINAALYTNNKPNARSSLQWIKKCVFLKPQNLKNTFSSNRNQNELILLIVPLVYWRFRNGGELGEVWCHENKPSISFRLCLNGDRVKTQWMLISVVPSSLWITLSVNAVLANYAMTFPRPMPSCIW